jgi:hypothetical protein
MVRPSWADLEPGAGMYPNPPETARISRLEGLLRAGVWVRNGANGSPQTAGVCGGRRHKPDTRALPHADTRTQMLGSPTRERRPRAGWDQHVKRTPRGRSRDLARPGMDGFGSVLCAAGVSSAPAAVN